MSWWSFNKLLFTAFIFIYSGKIKSQDSTIADMERQKVYKEVWVKFIPSYLKIQVAGSMGLVSVGVGWDYGKKRQWETDAFFGYVPKYETDKSKVTFTLKQNYIPWKWKAGRKVTLEPLTTGVYANLVFGEEFWLSEPDKYPNKYYSFSTKVRFNIFAGQRATFHIKQLKRLFNSVTAFYELSASDLNLIRGISNKYLKMDDYVSLSLGLKFQTL